MALICILITCFNFKEERYPQWLRLETASFRHRNCCCQLHSFQIRGKNSFHALWFNSEIRNYLQRQSTVVQIVTGSYVVHRVVGQNLTREHRNYSVITPSVGGLRGGRKRWSAHRIVLRQSAVDTYFLGPGEFWDAMSYKSLLGGIVNRKRFLIVDVSLI